MFAEGLPVIVQAATLAGAVSLAFVSGDGAATGALPADNAV